MRDWWQKSDRRIFYILTGISPNSWWTRSENHRGRLIWTTNTKSFDWATQELYWHLPATIHTQAKTKKPSKNWTPEETDEHPVHSTRTQWPAANELTTTTVQVLEQREGKTRVAPVALKQNWRPASSLCVRENWPERTQARDWRQRRQPSARQLMRKEIKSGTQENDDRGVQVGSKNQKSKSAPLTATRRNLADESEGSKQDWETGAAAKALLESGQLGTGTGTCNPQKSSRETQKDFWTGAACNTEQQYEKTRSLERQSRPSSGWAARKWTKAD
jgi:hypothetical protein